MNPDDLRSVVTENLCRKRPGQNTRHIQHSNLRVRCPSVADAVKWQLTEVPLRLRILLGESTKANLLIMHSSFFEVFRYSNHFVLFEKQPRNAAVSVPRTKTFRLHRSAQANLDKN